MDIIRSSTILIILTALANTAISPAIAGDPPAVVRDTSGRTFVTVREYPSGNQILVRDRAGKTLYVIRPDFYGGGHLIQTPDGRTAGRIDSRSDSSGSYLHSLFDGDTDDDD